MNHPTQQNDPIAMRDWINRMNSLIRCQSTDISGLDADDRAIAMAHNLAIPFDPEGMEESIAKWAARKRATLEASP